MKRIFYCCYRIEWVRIILVEAIMSRYYPIVVREILNRNIGNIYAHLIFVFIEINIIRHL